MFFTLTDVILIVIIVIFVLSGFVLGLIGAVSLLVSIVAGLWVAFEYYQPIAGWLTPILLGNGRVANIIAFSFVFIIVNRLVAILFWIVRKVFKIIYLIPFLKSIDRLAGVILGFVEGVLITGLVIYIVAKFSPNIPWLVEGLNNSQIAHWLVWITQFITNFF